MNKAAKIAPSTRRIRIHTPPNYVENGAWLGIDYALLEKKGTNPLRPTLLVEVDYVTGHKPTTDRNLEGQTTTCNPFHSKFFIWKSVL